MSISELMQAMSDAGAPMEAIIIAVKAVESEQEKLEVDETRLLERERTRRYRQRRGMSEGEWAKLRAIVLQRDGMVCAYCGEPANHCDHIVPLSRGGDNSLENLTASCGPCNSSKCNKLLEEWRS